MESSYREKYDIFERHFRRKISQKFRQIMLFLDKKTQKSNNVWAFPVCYYSGQFFDNARVVFEKVKNDANIKKVVLYRDKENVSQVTGNNIDIIKLHSFVGYYWLFRSGVVFVRHCVFQDIGLNLDNENRLVVNLWHGIALKSIGIQGYSFSITGRDPFGAVIASSAKDKLVMVESFISATSENTWITGLPRNDLLSMPKSELWPEVESELEKVIDRKKGKKLLLFAPTFRAYWEEWENKAAYYQFTQEEKDALESLTKEHGYIIGIRTHLREERGVLEAFAGLDVEVFNDINETAMVLREADILITDYSSIATDYILMERPVFSFSYDYEEYKEGRGLIYDLNEVFPTPLCGTFGELIERLSTAMEDPKSVTSSEHYQSALELFHDNEVKPATALVIENIEKVINNKR